MSASTTIINTIVADLQSSSLAPRVFSASSEGYQSSLQSYFSQQEQHLQPAAIVIPQTAQDVADTIKIITKHYNPTTTPGPIFAIRSGGKAPLAGSANMNEGITIDLSALNTITVNTSTVTIGPGARWKDVYSTLESHGLGVAGGRDGTVGVGGLILGGGISYFAPERGMVCNDVVCFEVVCADGRIVKAREGENEDLWRALKGGGSNFGVVTGFEMRTFPLGKIWGGQNVWPVSTAAQHLDALYDFVADPTPDVHATVIQSFAVYQGCVIVNEGLKYTKAFENPPALKKFMDIEGCLHSTNKITTLTEASIEQAAFTTDGRRQCLITTAFQNDRHMLQHAFNTWNSAVPSIKPLLGVNWSLSLTHLPTTPLINSSSPLINALITISWDNASDDEFLLGKAKEAIAEIEREAKERELWHRYVYANYAWEGQKVLEGYGEERKGFLRAVSRKWDGEGLWQRGLGGGWKLWD